MIIGVLKEKWPETRVSLVPNTVKELQALDVQVWIEPGAGENAFHSDEAYKDAGASVKAVTEIVETADIILAIQPDSIPTNMTGGKILIGVFQPLWNADQIAHWTAKGHTVLSLDSIPRTTRAQSMDVLSSQANIAGYKAVLLAANQFSRYFPMFMTAAGSIPPAKVLILGAGVAGLQAIATARRLGAVVTVFDTRPTVKEEVLSLGGKFIEVEGASDASAAGGYAVTQTESFLRRQKEKITEHIAKTDIVITTAQIPGKTAPILVDRDMIEAMQPGSVIVDLAAATGGNTELTKNRETVVHRGITIIGHSSLPSTMPADASKLYSKNVFNFLKLIIDPKGNINLHMNDDIVQATWVNRSS